MVDDEVEEEEDEEGRADEEEDAQYVPPSGCNEAITPMLGPTTTTKTPHRIIQTAVIAISQCSTSAYCS